MKMWFTRHKKIVISLGLTFVIFMSGLLGFVIIPNALDRFTAASSIPANRQSVSGNGGAAVMVGDYLYFTSGFQSRESFQVRDNNHNSRNARQEGNGGIWRVRLTNGTPQYDNSYLNNLDNWTVDMNNPLYRFDMIGQTHNQRNEIANAMNHRLACCGRVGRRNCGNLELIVPQIAGWENTAMWIFDNHLIYTTPNNLRDRHGQVQRHRTDFFRVDLDGRNHRRIYTSHTNNLSRENFTVAWADNQPFLLVLDGANLVRVDMRGRTTTIATNATSAVFPVVESYFEWQGAGANQSWEASFQGIMGYIFYTVNYDGDHGPGGNVLRSFRISGGRDAGRQLRHGVYSHTLHALGNGHLVFDTSFDEGTELYIIGDVLNSVGGFERAPGVNEFQRGNLNNSPTNSSVRMSVPLQQGEQIFLSGERTTRPNFSFIVQNHQELRVFNRPFQANGTTQAPLPLTQTTTEEIILITPSAVKFQTGDSLVTINKDGTNETMVEMTDRDPMLNTRVSAFRVLGTNNFKFFYIRDIEEVDGDLGCTDQDCDHDHGNFGNAASMSVAIILDARNHLSRPGVQRDFILARLGDNFIDIPENIVNN